MTHTITLEDLTDDVFTLVLASSSSEGKRLTLQINPAAKNPLTYIVTNGVCAEWSTKKIKVAVQWYNKA